MATTAEIQELITDYKRVAIAMAARKGIDADEAQGLHACAVVEAANSFDPDRGATLRTYAMSIYRFALERASAQARYGVELDKKDTDDEHTGDNTGALERLLADILGYKQIDEWDTEDDDEEEVDEDIAWRKVDSTTVASKIDLLPAYLRDYALLLLNSKSTLEASDILGQTDRNGRYMLEKIRAFLRALPADAGQSSLLSPELALDAANNRPAKPQKPRIPKVADLVTVEQLGLF